MLQADPSIRPTKAILTINSGASSVKFGLFTLDSPHDRLLSGAFERIGQPEGRLHAVDQAGGIVLDRATSALGHESALPVLLGAIELLAPNTSIVAAGHRIVHGGAEGDRAQVVTPELEARLSRLIPLAPLHQSHNLAAITAVGRVRPELPQVACFDTAFHHDLPRVAALTGLPRNLETAGVRRYGFHGLSYEYVTERLRSEKVDLDAERVIIAHLGDGASMCALRRGRSVETTMGFSTLAGLPMATRCGDLDPGLILYLLAKEGMTTGDLERLLYKESGWLGLSGVSRDMRELLNNSTHPEVKEAIDFFCYQSRKHLAALTATLGGIDRLVFTGGIGANAPAIRAGICEGLEYLGICLDERRNEDGARTISLEAASVVVEAFPTDEELVVARHVGQVLSTWGGGPAGVAKSKGGVAT